MKNHNHQPIKGASVCVEFNATYNTAQAQDFLQKLNSLMNLSESASITIVKGEKVASVEGATPTDNGKIATFDKIIYNLFNRKGGEDEKRYAKTLGRFVLAHTSPAERTSKRWANVCPTPNGNYNMGDIFEVVMTKKQVDRTGLHIKSNGDGYFTIKGEDKPVKVEVKIVSKKTKPDFKKTDAKYHLIGFNNGHEMVVKLIKTTDLEKSIIEDEEVKRKAEEEKGIKQETKKKAKKIAFSKINLGEVWEN